MTQINIYNFKYNKPKYCFKENTQDGYKIRQVHVALKRKIVSNIKTHKGHLILVDLSWENNVGKRFILHFAKTALLFQTQVFWCFWHCVSGLLTPFWPHLRWLAFLTISFLKIWVCTLRHRHIAIEHLIDYRIKITFSYTENPKNSRVLLYEDICFIAVI